VIEFVKAWEVVEPEIREELRRKFPGVPPEKEREILEEVGRMLGESDALMRMCAEIVRRKAREA